MRQPELHLGCAAGNDGGMNQNTSVVSEANQPQGKQPGRIALAKASGGSAIQWITDLHLLPRACDIPGFAVCLVSAFKLGRSDKVCVSEGGWEKKLKMTDGQRDSGSIGCNLNSWHSLWVTCHSEQYSAKNLTSLGEAGGFFAVAQNDMCQESALHPVRSNCRDNPGISLPQDV